MVTIIPCINWFFYNFRKAFYEALSSNKLRAYLFTTEECDSLYEYVTVMAPIAVNLDILQGDRQSYLGSLVPHIVHLKDELTDLRDGISGPPLVYTVELLEVLLGRLVASDRFGPILENLDYQMAACFHPSYKLNWIQFWDPEKYDGIRNHMITIVRPPVGLFYRKRPPQHARHTERGSEGERHLVPSTQDLRPRICSLRQVRVSG